MSADQLNQWNYKFLNDIGATNPAIQARDLGFLGAWENREGIGNLALFNPLGTTMRGFGGSPIPGQSAGVMSYPDIASGAEANAQALMGNNAGYAELLNAFQQGTLDQSAHYQGLSTWSNAGYDNLAGLPSTVPGGAIAAGSQNQSAQNQSQIAATGTQAQIALTRAQEQIDENYARSEAAFQQQLLGLQKEDLGNREATLQRQLSEAPILQGEIMKQFALQFAGIKATGQDVNRSYRQALTDLASRGAATGSSFTKGTRDQHANEMADWSSATAQLQRQKQALSSRQFSEEVQYMEQIAGYQDAKKQLDILSRRYNISGEEIASKLGFSLQQLQSGMDINVSDLYTQLMGIQAGVPLNYGAPNITSLSNTAAGTGPGALPTQGGYFQNPNFPIAGIGGGGYGS